MSRENPTALQVGMSGQLDGRRFTVRGRVVMSMEADDGETYYWQEFNLVDAGGSAVTLVWEETEEGPKWKWFTLYAQRQPLTAAEAAQMTEGDNVQFEGRQITVTLTDSTKVAYIEGEGPEDVEVGDVAHYFNADAGGGRLFVASWSDDYIEFYLGRELPDGQVERAFNLIAPEGAMAFSGTATDIGRIFSSPLVRAVGIGLIGLLGYFGPKSCSTGTARAPAPPVLQQVVAPALPTGAHGTLEGRDLEVRGHARIEIAAPGARYSQDEYVLGGPGPEETLLMQGLTGQAGWIVLKPVPAPADFTAVDAAALRQNDPLTLAGQPTRIARLFVSFIRQTDNPAASARWPAQRQYGFIARNDREVILARWSENDLQLYAGHMVPQEEVLAAFKPAK